jgi:hypothetical protein
MVQPAVARCARVPPAIAVSAPSRGGRAPAPPATPSTRRRPGGVPEDVTAPGQTTLAEVLAPRITAPLPTRWSASTTSGNCFVWSRPFRLISVTWLWRSLRPTCGSRRLFPRTPSPGGSGCPASGRARTARSGQPASRRVGSQRWPKNQAGRCSGGRSTHGINATASLQISGRTTSLAGVREVSLGTSLSAVNLNHGGSMEGIPPGWTGHRRA